MTLFSQKVGPVTTNSTEHCWHKNLSQNKSKEHEEHFDETESTWVSYGSTTCSDCAADDPPQQSEQDVVEVIDTATSNGDGAHNLSPLLQRQRQVSFDKVLVVHEYPRVQWQDRDKVWYNRREELNMMTSNGDSSGRGSAAGGIGMSLCSCGSTCFSFTNRNRQKDQHKDDNDGDDNRNYAKYTQQYNTASSPTSPQSPQSLPHDEDDGDNHNTHGPHQVYVMAGFLLLVVGLVAFSSSVHDDSIADHASALAVRDMNTAAVVFLTSSATGGGGGGGNAA